MAGSNLTLLSNYYTDQSGPWSCLSLGWGQLLLWFMQWDPSSISWRILCFKNILVSCTLYHSPFCTLPSNTDPFPFLPFSIQCSWNQTAFYILLQLIQCVSDCIYKFYNFSTSEYMLQLPRSIINTCNRISSSLWTWASHIQTISIFYYTMLMDKQKM